MHTLDILFIITAVFFVIVGVRRGLIGEIFRLVGLVAGFFIAFLRYTDAGHLIKGVPTAAANAIGFTAIFLAVMLAVIGLGWLLKKAVHLTPLGWIDYLCGGTIGFSKVVIIFWVICLSLASLPSLEARVHAGRSMVFRTYRTLPQGLKLVGMERIRTIFKKSVDSDLPKKLKQTQQSAERLKEQVDSLQRLPFRYR